VTVAVAERRTSAGHVEATSVSALECPRAYALFRGLPVTRGRTLASAVPDRETPQETRLRFQDQLLNVGKRPVAGGCRVVAQWRSLEQIVAVSEAPCRQLDVAVRWAGDLDGDGLPDLLLDLGGTGACGSTRLLLSTRAAAGRLFGEAAQDPAGGC
jgi:hypothetical protein